MRCKACNKVLSIIELKKKNSIGEYEDLCFSCLFEAGEIFFEDVDDFDFIDDELGE